MALGRLTLAVTWLTLAPQWSEAQQQRDCFTSSSVVGAVLGTFFATAIAAALLSALLFAIYKRRLANQRGNEKARGVESGAGFDNPAFETHPDATDGGKAEQSANKEGKEGKTSTSWTPLRFFGKKRSLDDSFISEAERVSVQLRGHDFTGLGFNVAGNMRDGICIKDLLNRGPAFESAKIAPGDKIVNVTVSFRHIVYDDAVTILSYASPYDVTLELEKASGGVAGVGGGASLLRQRGKAPSSVSLTVAAPSAASAAPAGALDASVSNERLVHPLYRSQSIDDLSKIGRAETSIRADVKFPHIKARVGGVGGVGDVGGVALTKSKLLSKVASVDPSGASISKDVAIDMGVVDVDVDVKAPKFSKFGIKVLPDLKFKNQKTAKVKLCPLPVGLDAPDVEMGVSIPKNSADVRIDVPDVNIDVPDGTVISSGGGVDDFSLDIDAPFMSLSSDASGVGGVGSVHLKGPEVGVDVDVKDVKSGFNLKFPKFGHNKSGSTTSSSSVGVGVDVDLPSVELQAPSASVKSGFKLPGFSSKKKSDASVDIEAGGASLDVEVPSVASLDAKKSTKMSFSMPKFGKGQKMPKGKIDVDVDGVDINLPTVDVDLPAISVDMAAKNKSTKLDVDVQLPKAAIDVDVPKIDVDVDVGAKKKSKFGFKLPKFDLRSDASDTSDSEINKMKFDVKDADISIDVPKTDVDVHLPGVEIDVDAKKKSKFGIKMPKFDINLPKFDNDAVDVDIEVPKTDVDVHLPDIKVGMDAIDVDAPKTSVDIHLPGVDVDVDAKKKSKFGMKMPKFDINLPKFDVDFRGDASDASGDEKSKKKSKFDVKLPKGNIDVDVNLPKSGIDVVLPDVNVDIDAKTKSKFDVNLPKGKFDVDVQLPKAEIDVDMPKADVDFNLPGVDIDVGGKKKSKFGFKLPKFDLRGDASDASDDESSKKKFDVKVPRGGIDVDVNLPTADVDFELPKTDVDVHLPGVEVDVDSKKKSKFGMKMPKFDINLPKFDVDFKRDASDASDASDDEDNKKKIDIKLAKGKFDVDVNLPSVDIDVDAPKADVDVDLPGVDIDVSGKKKSKFGMKMPKFDLTMPKFEVDVKGESDALDVKLPKGKLDVEVNLAKADMDVELPKTDIDVNLPGVDTDVSGKKKSKFGIKMPKFGKSANMDVDMDVPDVKMDVGAVEDDDDAKRRGNKFSMKMPKFGVMNKPNVNVEHDVGVGGVGSVQGPSVHLDVDVDGKSNKKKSKFGLKMPKISANIPDVPDVSDDSDAEGLEIKFPVAKFESDSDADAASKNWKVKLPRLEMDADMDVADASVKMPKIDVELPKFRASGDVDVDSSDMEDFKMGVAFPEMKKASLDVDAAKLDVDMDAGDVAKFKGPKFAIKLPKFSKKKSDVEGANSCDDSDADDADRKKMGVIFPKIKMKKPSLDVDADVGIDAAKLELGVGGVARRSSVSSDDEDARLGYRIDVADVTGPKMDVDVDLDDAKKGAKFSFKMPKFHMGRHHGDEAAVDVDANDAGDASKKKSRFSVKMPKFHMNKPSVELEAGDVDGAISVDHDASDVAKQVNLDVDVEKDAKKKGKFSFRMPKLHMGHKSHADGGGGVVGVPSVPSVAVPEVASVGFDINSPKVQVDVHDVHGPNFDAETSASGQFRIDTPDAPDVHFKASKSPFIVKMPQLEIVKPKIDVDGVRIQPPTLDVDLDVAGIAGKPFGKVDVHLSDVQVTGSVPEVDIELPALDIDIPEASGIDFKKKGTKFGIKLPQFPSAKAEINIPEVDVPEVDIADAEINVNLPDIPGAFIPETKKKGKFGGFKLPSMPSGKMEVTIPDADISVDVPEVADFDADVSLDATKKKSGKFGGFKMPHFPSGKVEIHAPEAPEFNVEIPDAEISVPGVVDLDAEVSIDAKKKVKFGGFKMPHFPSGKAEVHLPEAEVNIQLPDAEVNLPDIDVDDAKKKVKFGGFKMPHFPSAKAEVNLSEAELNVNLPEVDFDADASVEAKIKTELRAMKMPPLPSGKVEVSLPESELDIRIPEVDFDADASIETKKKSGKFGGFKMPHFPSGRVDVHPPEAEFSIQLPDVEAEAAAAAASADASIDLKKKSKKGFNKKISLPSAKVELSGAEADIRAPEAADESDDEPEEKKHHKFGIKMPKFHLGGSKKTQISGPSGSSGGTEVSVDLPEVPEIGAADGGWRKPKVAVKVTSSSSADFPAAGVVDVGDVEADTKVALIDAEVAKVQAQLNQLQANMDVTDVHLNKKKKKKRRDASTSSSSSSSSTSTSSSSSDDDDDDDRKSGGFHLKMPKFSRGGGKSGDADDAGRKKHKKKAKEVHPEAAGSKSFKVNLKGGKDQKKKREGGHDASDASDVDSPSTRLMDRELKLPRVQVYKNVEYVDAGGDAGDARDASSSEEDEGKDIKKNIGARFGVKLKKPKMFSGGSSSKVEITSAGTPKPEVGTGSVSLQPEWRLPRVDLRRTPRHEQELSVDVGFDTVDASKIAEQLSPSERTDAIRRDAKSSTGIRIHSPRSKKLSLDVHEAASAPKLLSVTRLETPPADGLGNRSGVYHVTAEGVGHVAGQVPMNQVPASVLMASDAVKMKRGPPTPAKRTFLAASAAASGDAASGGAFRVALPVRSPTIPDLVSPAVISGEVSVTSQAPPETNQVTDAAVDVYGVATCSGSDTTVVISNDAGSNRKASSLDDLTRLKVAGVDDASLERTVSLNFKSEMSASAASRQLTNQAVQDLSRLGDYDNLILEITGSEMEISVPSSRTTLDAGNGDAADAQALPATPESLWFGSTTIHMTDVETVTTAMTYSQLATSLGTSPPDTSSSSDTDDANDAAGAAATTSVPAGIALSSTHLMQSINNQVGNGSSGQQYFTQVTTTSTLTTPAADEEEEDEDEEEEDDDDDAYDDESQPQPLTDLNPSAGNFAAVRNRFEQLSADTNGAETPVTTLTTLTTPLNQGAVKRLSGNFEEGPLQKSYVHIGAPELSEGALSRTVIISSLQLERSDSSVGGVGSVGPESPVPNLEPPC